MRAPKINRSSKPRSVLSRISPLGSTNLRTLVFITVIHHLYMLAEQREAERQAAENQLILEAQQHAVKKVAAMKGRVTQADYFTALALAKQELRLERARRALAWQHKDEEGRAHSSVAMKIPT